MRMAVDRSGEAGLARSYMVVKKDGHREPFNESVIMEVLEKASISLPVDRMLVMGELIKTAFDGMTTIDVEKSLVLAAATFIERDPAYSLLAARLLRQNLF